MEVPAGAVALGAMVPLSLQYSPLLLPLAVAATIADSVTVAPDVGRPISVAAIVLPLSSAHEILETGESVSWSVLDPQATIKTIDPITDNRFQLNSIFFELVWRMLISNSG
ncbi:hypothetical protein [Limnohabitans sp. Rim8]|uniref:hypothetical protein n=1 Tax=Limnohabitans sp. Rim8 TaxID=1100718 RepID=UPI00261C6911|nr:hypothetical protein [Limnohabitans sp. Rim8]